MNRRELKSGMIAIVVVLSIFAFGCFSSYKMESLLVFAGASVILNSVFFRKRRVVIPQILVLLLVVQNLFIGVFSHLSGNVEGLSYMTQCAYVFCVVSFVFAIVNEKRITKLDIAFIVFCSILLVMFIMTQADKTSALVYFRNFTVFYCAYVIGKYYIDDLSKNEKYISFLVTVSIVVVFLGLFMMNMPLEMWQGIGIHEVYEAKKNPFPLGQLPGRFYTTFLSGNYIQRMASIYYEPVNLSYLLAGTAALMMCIKKMERKWFTFIFLCVGSLLTFGKGGLLLGGLLFGITFCQIFFEQLTCHFPKKKILAICFGGILVALVAVSIWYYVFIGGTAVLHFMGIFESIPFILKSPLGYGLGMGGNIGAATNSYAENISLLQSGGESGLMSMFFQLGIGGGLYFIILWIAMGQEIKNTQNLIFSRYARYYLRFIPVFLIIISIFQENTYTPQCIIPIMIGLGGLSNQCRNIKEGEMK